jgi:RNA polymerase sigma factor (sigma-70 family)
MATGPEWVIAHLHSDNSADPRHEELVACAQRLWPRVISYAKKQSTPSSSFDDKVALATEVWEKVLLSVAQTLKRGEQEVVDLDAYLVGAFQHRFHRALRKERIRQRTLELVAPEELHVVVDNSKGDWLKKFEKDIQVRQIVESMDDWTREVWISRQYGYSWRDIAKQLGVTEQQVKMRFRYALAKVRLTLTERSPKNRLPDEKEGKS